MLELVRAHHVAPLPIERDTEARRRRGITFRESPISEFGML
ncbi:MAG: hypothetical protein WAL63_05425 [Solirubrobacteraceae bacterium]